MSREDQVRQLVGDLLTWLRQNDGPEGAWYLACDPPQSAAAAMAPAVPPVQAAERPAAPAPAQTAPAPVADDPFAAVCTAFVHETLDLIRRQEEVLGPGPAASAPDSDPAAALDALRAEVGGCTACSLAGGRTNVVFGAGIPTAGIVFVGEAPGRDEDLQGEPFVGRSGQLLTKILSAIGLAREEAFICNILKCRPPENRDPLPPEVAACEPFLQRQLEILRPRVICCLGRVAAQTLLRSDASLSRLRKTVHFYRNIPVLVTYHPAYLLRNPAAKRDTWDDVRKLRALHDALAARDGQSL